MTLKYYSIHVEAY